MPAALPIRRVVLYKHGVGYFERKGRVSGSEALHLDFKARDMNDMLKSMTVLDLSGGAVSAVSYDSTKPLEQLLEEATIRSPDAGSLTALLGQIKGARVRVRVGGKESVEGVIVGLESLAVVEGKASVVRASGSSSSATWWRRRCCRAGRWWTTWGTRTGWTWTWR